ncbi:unnamed protein product [Lampetra fluviatilis]
MEARILRVRQVLTLMEQTLECPICLDIMKEPISTKCDHQFCRFCILELLEKSKGPALCPMCKETVTRRSLRENPMFKQIVAGVQRTMQAFQEDTGLQFTAAPGPPEVSVWGSSEPNRRPRGSRRPRTLDQSRAGANSLSETVSSRPKRQRAQLSYVELDLDSLSDDGEPWIIALAAEDGLKSSSFRRSRAQLGGDTTSDGARQRGEAPSAPPPLAGEWSRDLTSVAGDANPNMKPSPTSAAPSGNAAAMARQDDASSPAPATVNGEVTEEVKVAAPPAKKSKRIGIRKVKEWLQKMDVAGEPKSASPDHVDGADKDDDEGGGGGGDMADGGGDGAADSISGGSERTTLLEDHSMEVSPVPVVVPLMELEKPLLTMNPGDRLFGKRYGRQHKLLPRARVRAAKRSRGASAPVCASIDVAVIGAGGSGGVVRVVGTAGAPDDTIAVEMSQVAASTRPPSTGKAVGKRRPRRSTELSPEDFIRREPPSAVALTTGSVHAVREDGGMRGGTTRPKRRKLKNEASSHTKVEAPPHQGNNGLPQEQRENNGVPLQQRENGFALQPDASPKQGGENGPSLPQDINTSPLQQAVNETPLQPQQQQPRPLRKSTSAQKRLAAKVHRYHSVGDGSKSRRRLELQIGGPSHVSWVPATIESFSSSEDALRNSPLQANKRRRSLGILGKDVRLADNDEGFARPRVTPPSADDGAGGLHENRSVSPGQKLPWLCDHKCHGSPSVVPETPCTPAPLLLVAAGAAGGCVVTAPALARRCDVCLERMLPGAVTAGSTVASPQEAHRARHALHGTATTEPEHKPGSKDADCCGAEVSPNDTPDGLLVLPEEGAEQDGRVSEGGREHGGDCTGVMAVTLTPAETLVERRGGPEEASGSNGSVVENSQSLLHSRLERSGTEERAKGAGEALSLVDVSIASQMQKGLTRSMLNLQQEPTLNKSDLQLESTQENFDPQEVRTQDKFDTHQEITPYKLNQQQERTQDELCPQRDLTQYKSNTHQELTPPDLSAQQEPMPDSLPPHQEPIATTLIPRQETMGNDLQQLNEAANFPREVKDVSKGVGSVEDGVVSMEDSEVDTQVALLSFLPSKRRSFRLVSPGASHQSETHRTGEHQTSTHRGGGNQAETRGADEKQTISRQTGDNQTIIPPNGDNQTGDNQTGDNQTTIHQTSKHQIISLQTGDNQTITNPTCDNQTGDHQTICRQTGDNQTSNQQTDVNQTITHSASDSQTGDSQTSTYQSGDNQTIIHQISDDPISTSQTSDIKTSIHLTGHEQTDSHKPVASQNNAHLASLPSLSADEIVHGNRLTKRTRAGRCARRSGSSWRSSPTSPGRDDTLRGGAGSGDESTDTLQLQHGKALLSPSGTDSTPDIIMPTQRNTTDHRPGSLAARSHTSAITSSQEDSSGRPSISTMADSQPKKVIGSSQLLTCGQSDMLVGSGAGLGQRRSLIASRGQPEVKVVNSSPSIDVDIGVSDLAVAAVSNSPHVAAARDRKQRWRRRRIRVIVSSSSSDSDCEVKLPSLGVKVKWQQQGGMLASPRDKGGPRTSPPTGSTLPASSPPLSQCSTASMDLFESEGSVWGRHGPSSPGDRDGAEGRAEVAEATGLTTSAGRRRPLNGDPESGGEGDSAAEPRSRRDGILENESESTVIWASQDVDSEMKQELMRNLHEMGDEIAALEAALEDQDDCLPLPPTPPSLCPRWKVGARGQTAAQTLHRDDGNGELAGALSRRVSVGAVDRGSAGHGGCGRAAASSSWETERSDTLSDARCYVDTAASGGGGSVTFPGVAQHAERLVGVSSAEESSGNPRRLCLVASGLSKQDALVVKQFVHKTGGSFQSHFSPETTHVLMQTGGSLVCERTLKYFLGNAGHCWVLTFSWVEECLRQGCVVDEVPFEIQGDVVNGREHLGPRRSRLATLKLLREYEICCYGAFKDMTKAELECLVQMSGAVLVKDPSAFSFHPNFVPLLVMQPDANAASMDFTALHRLYSAQIVTREWVLDCIATHRVRLLDTYLLSPHTAPRRESP